jgi:multidrug resistance efflux pump
MATPKLKFVKHQLKELALERKKSKTPLAAMKEPRTGKRLSKVFSEGELTQTHLHEEKDKVFQEVEFYTAQETVSKLEELTKLNLHLQKEMDKNKEVASHLEAKINAQKKNKEKNLVMLSQRSSPKDKALYQLYPKKTSIIDSDIKMQNRANFLQRRMDKLR